MEEDRKQDESKQETPEAVKDTESGAVDAAAAETVAEKLPEKLRGFGLPDRLEAGGKKNTVHFTSFHDGMGEPVGVHGRRLWV